MHVDLRDINRLIDADEAPPVVHREQAAVLRPCEHVSHVVRVPAVRRGDDILSVVEEIDLAVRVAVR